MSRIKNKLLENTDNFDASIVQPIRDKLYTLAIAVQEDFISDFGESHASPKLEPIYGYSYDGYIAFQLGGYEVTEFYPNDIDPTFHFTKAQTDFNNKHLEECYKSFAWEHDLENDFTIDCLSPEIQDKFYEYEQEWFEPALLRFEMWLKDSNTVEIRLGINYKDAPYYRSKEDETIFTVLMRVQDLMHTTTEQFLKLLKEEYESI